MADLAGIGAPGDAGAGAPAATLELVRAALGSGDISEIAYVLAPDVRWYGSGPGGGCRTRAEVLQTLDEAFRRDGVRPELRDARIAGDRLVLELAMRDAGERPDESWFVLSLDARGRITELQAYSSAAAAEHDLAIHARAAARVGDGPPHAVSGLVPFVHVGDVARSMAFYGRLGFEPLDRHDHDGELVWVFLRSGDASLMLSRADAPIDHRAQAFFFYLYSEDLAALRDELVAHGLAPGEIVDGSPGPRAEMLVADPDGYVLMIAQIETPIAPD